MVRKIISIMLAVMMSLSVFAVAVSAQDTDLPDDTGENTVVEYEGNYVRNVTTGVEYATFTEAAKAVKNRQTLMLLYNTSISSYTSISKNGITIDLAGYELMVSGMALDLYGSATIIDSVGGGRIVSAAQNAVWVNADTTVTLDGAKIDGTVIVDGYNNGDNAVFVMESGEINGTVYVQGQATAIINGGTVADKKDSQPVYAMSGASVEINDGNISGNVSIRDEETSLTVNGGTFTSYDCCISNYSTGRVSSTDITINGGTFRTSSKLGVAVFHPNAGTLTINGGTFTGGDALYIKSGDVTINGGKFYAVGAKADFRHDGNGFNSTGDTVVIESCGNPGGQPTLAIYAGTFFSKNNKSIGCYVYGDNAFDSTAFVYKGTFEREVPAEYWVNSDVFTLFNVDGGFATYNKDTNKITVRADEGAIKIEVSKYATNGEEIVFSDLQGGAQLSKANQLFARQDGKATVTIGSETYEMDITFDVFNVTELLRITNATVSVSANTITLAPINNSAQVNVSLRTTADTIITVNSVSGAAAVSKGGTLYAKADATANITVPNAGTYTVTFEFEEDEFKIKDNLRVTNATVDVNGNMITLTPVDDTANISVVPKLLDGSVITFDNLSKFARISKNGSLYSSKYSTATATIRGIDYNVVLDFAPEAVPLADNLRITNATAAVDGTTITLTPIDGTASVSMVAKLLDGTAVAFSNLSEDARISKSGSLYSKSNATARATIDGVAYTVVFDFGQEEVSVADNVTVSGATVTLEGTTLTLTATDTQANIYPRLKDGTTAAFSDLSGAAKLSKSGTAYAKANGSLVMTIGGVDYTVVFVF